MYRCLYPLLHSEYMCLPYFLNQSCQSFDYVLVFLENSQFYCSFAFHFINLCSLSSLLFNCEVNHTYKRVHTNYVNAFGIIIKWATVHSWLSLNKGSARIREGSSDIPPTSPQSSHYPKCSVNHPFTFYKRVWHVYASLKSLLLSLAF